jgi:hypothetical protein
MRATYERQYGSIGEKQHLGIKRSISLFRGKYRCPGIQSSFISIRSGSEDSCQLIRNALSSYTYPEPLEKAKIISGYHQKIMATFFNGNQ